MKEAARLSWRLLTFRASAEELRSLGWCHLPFGLLCTWLVGMGRYWDDPGAHFLQHLGVGSLLYVFALAALLWLVALPLRPAAGSYVNVLAFVTLVSPPAILYAVPVERFCDLHTASSLNVWFLAVVACWRVALLLFYLGRGAMLPAMSAVVATALPLAGIVTVLAILNLERAVFNLMGGSKEHTAVDAAYAVVFFLSMISVMAIIPLSLLYLILVWRRWMQLRAKIGKGEKA